MTLSEALTLPIETTISSFECIIKNEIHTFSTKRGTAHIYSISDVDKTCDAQLVIWDKSNLIINDRYKLESTINNGRLSGISISKYKDYPSRIDCKKNTNIRKIENNMDIIEYKPLNDKQALMNYYGKTYIEMRNKLLSAPDVSSEHAHQAAMDFVNWIPKSFFGDKPLP